MLGLKFFCTLSFQKCSIAFYLSLLVVQISDAYVNVLSIIVFFSLKFLFLKHFVA